MNGKYDRTRLTVLLTAVAVLLAGTIIAGIHLSGSGETHEIILPSPTPAASAPPAATAPAEDNAFLEVSAENLRALLESLNQSATYYRRLRLDTIWSGGSASRSVEVWKRGDLMRVSIAEPDGDIKCIICTPDESYIWYEGGGEVLRSPVNDEFTVEAITGIPSVQGLLEKDGSSLSAAKYVILDSMDDLACIYVEAGSGLENQVERYWVSLDTGLVAQAQTIRYTGQNAEYSEMSSWLWEQSMEVLPATDSVFDEKFTLPDGTTVSG